MIRNMCEQDRQEVHQMMQVFYNSPAVLSNGSDEIFKNDIDNCINDNPYVEGFVFEEENQIQGYAMIAKSFSTEFGRACIWIEDLYMKPEYRSMGLGNQFFTYLAKLYPDVVFRLEAEEENEGAVRLYKKMGFEELPYMELKK